MFYHRRMVDASPDVATALASLRERWGGAAPVIGALARAPEPSLLPDEQIAERLADEAHVVRTGFPALDAILGPGGVPRQASLAVLGEHSSGKTTLALRLAAEAQAAGGIVAYLDLARSLDPVEAVARGVQLEWLVVLTPADLDEGLAMAGALLQARAVDLLLIDLPVGRGASGGPRKRDRPGIPERLHRLTALARRAGTLLVVLEPPGLPSATAEALAEAAGLRLELARRSWIRLGRDVIGQRTEVVVARNRFGPPGRRAELRILYAEGGDRDACLARGDLLREIPAPGRIDAPGNHSIEKFKDHETPPPLLATSAPPSRQVALRVLGVPERSGHPGRPALDGGLGTRRQPGGRGARRPARDGARQRTSAGA
jgi:RecA/RadA recombinase